MIPPRPEAAEVSFHPFHMDEGGRQAVFWQSSLLCTEGRPLRAEPSLLTQ